MALRELFVRLQFQSNQTALKRTNTMMDRAKVAATRLDDRTKQYTRSLGRNRRAQAVFASQMHTSMAAATTLTGRMAVMNQAVMRGVPMWQAAGSMLWQYRLRLLALTGVMAAFIGMAVKRSADAAEAVNAFNVMLGENAGAIEKWAKAYADAIKVDPLQIMEASTRVAPLIRQMNLSTEETVAGIQDMTRAVFDLASIKNLRIEDAITNIASGLAGETEALRRHGIMVDQETLQLWAFREGLIASGEQLTQQQKRFLTLQKILHDMENLGMTGDMQRTADSTANALRALGSQIDRLFRSIGSNFERFFGPVIVMLRDFFHWVNQHPMIANLVAGFTGLLAIGGALSLMWGGLAAATIMYNEALLRLNATGSRTTARVLQMLNPFRLMGRVLSLATGGLKRLVFSLDRFHTGGVTRQVGRFSTTMRTSTAQVWANARSLTAHSMASRTAGLQMMAAGRATHFFAASTKVASLAVTFFGKAFRLALGPIGWAIFAVEMLTGWVSKLFGKLFGFGQQIDPMQALMVNIRDKSPEVQQELQQLFSDFQVMHPDLQGGALFDQFVQDLREKRPELASEVSGAIDDVEEEMSKRRNLFQRIGSFLGEVPGHVGNFFGGIFQGIGSGASSLFDSIGKRTEAYAALTVKTRERALELASNLIGSVVNRASALFSTAQGYLFNFGETVRKRMTVAGQWFAHPFVMFAGGIEGIKQHLINFGRWLQTSARRLLKPFEDAWNFIKRNTVSILERMWANVQLWFERMNLGYSRFETTLEIKAETISPLEGLTRLVEHDRLAIADELRKLADNFRELHPELRGQELFDQFIRDLKLNAPEVYQQLESIMAEMDAYLPHSPAKKGPLQQLDLVGPGFMQTIASGIERYLPKMRALVERSMGTFDLAGLQGQAQRAIEFVQSKMSRIEIDLRAPDVSMGLDLAGLQGQAQRAVEFVQSKMSRIGIDLRAPDVSMGLDLLTPDVLFGLMDLLQGIRRDGGPGGISPAPAPAVAGAGPQVVVPPRQEGGRPFELHFHFAPRVTIEAGSGGGLGSGEYSQERLYQNMRQVWDRMEPYAARWLLNVLRPMIDHETPDVRGRMQ